MQKTIQDDVETYGSGVYMFLRITRMILNKSKCFLTLLVIFLVLSLICVNFANGQTNDESERTISLEIHVLSIDTSVRNANVTIYAMLFS